MRDLRRRESARLWSAVAGLVISGLAAVGYTATAEQAQLLGVVVAIGGPLLVNALMARFIRGDVYSRETVERIGGVSCAAWPTETNTYAAHGRPVGPGQVRLEGDGGPPRPHRPLAREGPRADNPPDPGDPPGKPTEHDDPR